MRRVNGGLLVGLEGGEGAVGEDRAARDSRCRVVLFRPMRSCWERGGGGGGEAELVVRFRFLDDPLEGG